MIDCMLAAAEAVKTFTQVEPIGILVFLCYGFIVALIIIGLIRLVRFLGSAGKEVKLTRMEVGKLAEEFHQLRQELKGEKKQDSSSE